MSQLRQHQSELARLKVDVKVVTFDNDCMSQAYLRDTQLTWPLLIDSRQELYQAYGLLRASWWTLLNPVTILGYLKLMWLGVRPGWPGSDWQQLGGDVIIDPTGNIRLKHISHDPHDRPTIATIMEIILKGNAIDAL